jgi:hypothetical protein
MKTEGNYFAKMAREMSVTSQRMSNDQAQWNNRSQAVLDYDPGKSSVDL